MSAKGTIKIRFVQAARPTADPQRVADKIRQRESRWRARVYAFLIGGAILSLLGPSLLGAMFYFGARAPCDPRHGALVFAMCIVTMVPLLFLIETLTHGKFFEDAAENMGDFVFRTFSARGLQFAILLEIWLWGPRMVFAGVERFRRVQEGATCDYRTAAQIVCRLLSNDGGMPSAEVVDGLPKLDSAPAIAYLLCHEWIAMSKDGKRIWLNSDSRKLVQPVVV